VSGTAQQGMYLVTYAALQLVSAHLAFYLYVADHRLHIASQPNFFLTDGLAPYRCPKIEADDGSSP